MRLSLDAGPLVQCTATNPAEDFTIYSFFCQSNKDNFHSYLRANISILS